MKEGVHRIIVGSTQLHGAGLKAKRLMWVMYLAGPCIRHAGCTILYDAKAQLGMQQQQGSIISHNP
jgi:hypothetical protein